MTRAVFLATAWLLILPSASAPAERTSDSGDAPRLAELERINEALRGWLGAATGGAPFLLIDAERGAVQLRQNGALLRECRGVGDLGSAIAVQQNLALRIRRYRRSDPYLEAPPSPFDWEDYLAVAAIPDCALHFSGGLLLYASEEWGEPRSPSLKMSEQDLMVLYDALATGTVLVILPPGWRTGGAGDLTPGGESE